MTTLEVACATFAVVAMTTCQSVAASIAVLLILLAAIALMRLASHVAARNRSARIRATIAAARKALRHVTAPTAGLNAIECWTLGMVRHADVIDALNYEQAAIAFLQHAFTAAPTRETNEALANACAAAIYARLVAERFLTITDAEPLHPATAVYVESCRGRLEELLNAKRRT